MIVFTTFVFVQFIFKRLGIHFDITEDLLKEAPDVTSFLLMSKI